MSLAPLGDVDVCRINVGFYATLGHMAVVQVTRLGATKMLIRAAPSPMIGPMTRLDGDRLREARELLSMKQQEVADLVGVHRSTYLSWEKEGTIPRNRLAKLRAVLRLDDNLLPVGTTSTTGVVLEDLTSGELLARFNRTLAELSMLSTEIQRRAVGDRGARFEIDVRSRTMSSSESDDEEERARN